MTFITVLRGYLEKNYYRMSICRNLWILLGKCEITAMKDLLNRFVNGRCSDEEVRQVLKWYYSTDAENHYSDQVNRLTDEYARALSDGYDKEKIYRAVINKMNFKRASASHRFTQSFFVIKTAAAVSLCILLSFLIFKPSIDGLQPQVVSETDWIEKTTTVGQKSTVYLSDGTKVTLNAKSKIRFPRTLAGDVRNLWLEGEAFFEVAPDANRPFVVHADELQTTVLGTSFNISNYPEDRLVKVSLASGKIKINNMTTQTPGFEYLLNPGEGIVFNRENRAVKEVRFDSVEELSWKDGLLYFKDADFYEIVEELETWYGVTIQVAGIKQNDQNKLFTGYFNNESLQNVLEGLSFSKNFDFSIKNDIVLIKFR